MGQRCKLPEVEGQGVPGLGSEVERPSSGSGLVDPGDGGKGELGGSELSGGYVELVRRWFRYAGPSPCKAL